MAVSRVSRSNSKPPRSALLRGLTRVAWIGLSLVAGALLLMWTQREFPVAEAVAAFKRADVAWIAVAILCLLAGQFVRFARWRGLLLHAAPVSTGRVGRSIMDGQIINWLSPVRLGEVWRAWSVMRDENRASMWVPASIVVEKSADSLILGLYALILTTTPLASATNALLLRLLFGALAGFLVVGGLAALRPRLWQERALARFPASIRDRLQMSAAQVPPTVWAQLRRPGLWFRVIGLSLVVWLLAVATNVAVARALGIGLTWPQQLAFMLAIQLGLVISNLPANVGLFPLVAVAVFALFGLDRADALVFGSLLYVLVYGVNCAMWVAMRFWRGAAGARGLAPKTEDTTAGPVHSVVVDRVRVDGVTVPALFKRIRAALEQTVPVTIMYANAHAINLAHDDAALAGALNDADIVICDGRGVQLGSLLLWDTLPARLTPPDWVKPLARLCAERGAGLFLLGAQPGVASEAARALELACVPEVLAIATRHGLFGTEGPENDEVIQAIEASGAAVLLVGMGMPRQELWIQANRGRLTHVRVFISVGALFDTLSGRIARGPRWMTDYGLEWLVRLMREPRRLWRRYLIGNPLFLMRVLAQLIGIGPTA